MFIFNLFMWSKMGKYRTRGHEGLGVVVLSVFLIFFYNFTNAQTKSKNNSTIIF